MRALLFSFVFFLLSSCAVNDGVERGYIISDSKVEGNVNVKDK